MVLVPKPECAGATTEGPADLSPIEDQIRTRVPIQLERGLFRVTNGYREGA
jgi:hypothetical protein